jgi:hypothetical protein
MNTIAIRGILEQFMGDEALEKGYFSNLGSDMHGPA